MRFKTTRSTSISPNQLIMRSKSYNQYATYTAIFLSCSILSFIAGSLIIIPQGTKATTGLSLASAPVMSLTTSTNTLTMNVIPTASGTLASSSHNLGVSTNVPTGYNLSLTTVSTPTLAPTAGTITSPTALANNTWGYALASASAIGVINDFDTSYSIPIPNSASKWANPTTPATIKKTATSAIDDNTTVYYGAKIDLNQASGTYTNAIQYTATANLADIPTPTIISITPNSGATTGGTAIQIVGTGFTINDQSITTAVTVDDLNCENVSISSNTPATGQDTVYCNTPTHTTAEAVNVAITTWQNTTILTAGFIYITPTPTVTSPTAGQILNASTTNTNLTITTDIPGICYYGTTTNPTTPMTTTGSTSHAQSLTNLASNAAYTYYIRCQAATGHSYSPDVSVTFYVKATTPPIPTLSPTNGATVNNGTTTITVTSSGATCTWGTSNGSYPNASGTTRTTTTGTNTLYYSCIAGNGNTQSEARTGSWSYTGQAPIAQTGDAIQTVTTATCPTTRTRVNDARDNATYWIQKLADNRCWMLTNLAYGGGGTNTYGDIKSITHNVSYEYAFPYWYMPTGSNRTTGTTNPSISTSGIGQYGYLYNWCAAMGAQNTSACNNVNSPNINISICPSGWRLPTGGPGGEFASMTTAIGAQNSSTGSTVLRSTWLAMYSGRIYAALPREQDSDGYYWSASENSNIRAYYLSFNNSSVNPSNGGSTLDSTTTKRSHHAVRCVAI